MISYIGHIQNYDMIYHIIIWIDIRVIGARKASYAYEIILVYGIMVYSMISLLLSSYMIPGKLASSNAHGRATKARIVCREWHELNSTWQAVRVRVTESRFRLCQLLLR